MTDSENPQPGDTTPGRRRAPRESALGRAADRLTSSSQKAEEIKRNLKNGARTAAIEATAPGLSGLANAADMADGVRREQPLSDPAAPAPQQSQSQSQSRGQGQGQGMQTSRSARRTIAGAVETVRAARSTSSSPGSETGPATAAGGSPSDSSANSESAEPSTGQEVSKIAQAAAQGAVKGGITGAATGAGVAALKSKKMRRKLIWIFAPQIAVLAVIVMLVTAVFTIVTDTNTASAATEWSKARAAAERDGVSSAAAEIAAAAAEGTSVPPVIILASAKESGVSLDSEPEEYDKDAQEDAIEGDTALGPHAFIYDDTIRLARKLGISKPTFAELVDPEDSSRLYARMLGKIANRDGVPTPLDLGVGVVSTERDDSGEGELSDPVDSTSVDPTETPDSTEDPTGTDPDAGPDSSEPDTHDTYQLSDDPQDQAEAEKVKDDWVDVLGQAPVDGAEERAERIYDQAFQWYLGISGGCLAGATAGVAGQWANPIAAVGPPDGNGKFGPRPTSIGGGSGFHDGADLNGVDNEGTPIYAAGSGTVTVVNSTGYGPNWVKIDHGGGIVTEYGHMASATVKTGQQVGAGTQIGTEGNMGTWSEGAHLHFSVSWPDQSTDPAARGYVDPEAFFAERGITLGSNVVGVVVGAGDPTTGTGTAPPSQVGPDEVRIVQANIKTTTSLDVFMKHRDEIVALAPDFISFNEVSSRTPQQITPPGYSSYRDAPVYPVGESRGTAVAWRTDRWTMGDRGRIRLTESKVRLDNRWATWVTVRGAAGEVSFVSVHAMTNPRLYGPDRPARRENYKRGMENLNSLITTLSSRGPVFVAGDFNSRQNHDDPWGPEVMLAASGMQSSFDALGNVPAGAVVDYVFAQPEAGAIALRHGTWRLPDHPGVWADYKIGPVSGNPSTNPTTPNTGGTLPSSWTARPSAGDPITLTSQQLNYAQQIAAVGATSGVSDGAIIVAFMTVMVESKFKMYASDVYPETVALPHDAVGSDHDSVGLFQQRPQSGWGDPASLMDVAYSAKAFWGGPNGPNGGDPPGLLDVAGWETMPKGVAADEVQRSAFPDRYGYWEDAATELLGLVKGTATAAGTCGAAAGGSTSYVLGSFNVLGHSHTKPGGNKDHMGFDQYDDRLDSAVGYLQKYNVSVVGLQEFEPIQNDYLVANYGSIYDVYPKNTGLTDAVAWRKSDWTFVEGGTFTIPYFAGNQKPMPWVKLLNNATQANAVFISIHNPADVRGPAGQYRAEALRIEKEKVAALGADGSDVFLVGDFNDVNEPHCYLTPEMTSAFGAGTQNPCAAPAAVHIDQIFGAGSSTLSGGVQNKDANNKQTSDHPLVTASVTSSFGSAPSSYDLGAVHPDATNVANTLGPMFGIQTVGGIGVRSRPTCHTQGLGLDFMVPLTTQGKAQGQQLADYATANAVKLKINTVIFYQRIWTQARASEGWRAMSDRGSPTENHMDHVHISVVPCEF